MSEKCDCCERRYDTVYRVPDEIWKLVAQADGSGLLCPDCCDWLARYHGQELFWQAEVDHYPAPLGIRTELQEFVAEMEHQLREHDDRPGWKGESCNYLFRRMMQEIEELSNAMIFEASADLVREEAADVANFCMMIADVYGQSH